MNAVAAAIAVLLVVAACCPVMAADPQHPVMQWVKQHPRAGAAKPSPRMGYEGSYAYDPARGLLIRYGGHNQGGGGEQNSEVWLYDLATDVWALKQPNDAPPGVCCAAQNVFDEAGGKFVRFPAFSGSHGWQSFREIYLKDSSIWTYDLPTNTFRAMRPWPAYRCHALRGAAWDPHHQVIVLHGGQSQSHGTLVYDLYANRWRRMKPKTAPPSALSAPGFAYDAVNRTYALFGSQFGTDEKTWVYDLRANEWRVLAVDTHPPADKTAPVMAADTRNGIVLCVLWNEAKLETWALDVAKRTWKRLKLPAEPDPSGARNRVMLYLEDRNLFVLENRTKRQQQVWTFRYADAPPPAARPANLRVTTTADGSKLKWDIPVAVGRKASFHVYRGVGDEPWTVQLKPIAKDVAGGSFTDKGLKAGKTYFYQVRPVGEAGKEGRPSFLARTAPAVPADPLVSVISARKVELSWPESKAPDVVGWHVERAPVSVYSSAQITLIASRMKAPSDQAVGKLRRIGEFQRLTDKPIARTAYTDEGIDLSKTTEEAVGEIVGLYKTPAEQFVAEGKPYRHGVWAYRVRAVNRLGVVGGPSPYVLTIPATVEQVFSKESGRTAVELKWRAGREKGLAGYLVYRLSGRWNKDPVDLLTPEPIAGTRFTDKTAGRATRRYFIVSVDALGQQGLPSRPVWSRREWAKFYVPYISDWHQ